MQVSFLAALVGPRVAAAAAGRALEVIAEEDPAIAAEAAALEAKGDEQQDSEQERSSDPGWPLAALPLHQQVKSVPLRLYLNPCYIKSCPTFSPAGQVCTSQTVLQALLHQLHLVADHLSQCVPFYTPCLPLLSAAAPVSSTRIRVAAATAFGAAAVKAKMLADAEERDMQHQVQIAIEAQMQKVQLKLNSIQQLNEALEKERKTMEVCC